MGAPRLLSDGQYILSVPMPIDSYNVRWLDGLPDSLNISVTLVMLTSEWVKSYATKFILKCMVNHFTIISQKLLKPNPYHIYCHIKRLVLQISFHSLNKSFYGIEMQLSAGQVACCMLRAYWQCFRWNTSINFVFIVFIKSLFICKFTLRPEWIFNCIGYKAFG